MLKKKPISKTFYCSRTSNSIKVNFIEDLQEVEIFFSGTPQGNSLVSIENQKIVRSFKECLQNCKCGYLKFLKAANNCLDFGEIELFITEKNYIPSIEIFSKFSIPKKSYSRKIFLISDEANIVLRNILFTA